MRWQGKVAIATGSAKGIGKAIAIGLAQPEEIVGAAVFLASDESNYVAGQTIFVDGGWLAL